MSKDGILLLLAVAAVVVGWAAQNTGRVPNASNTKFGTPTVQADGTLGASVIPPGNVNATKTGAAADPTSTGLNNQSGTFSSGVQQ